MAALERYLIKTIEQCILREKWIKDEVIELQQKLEETELRKKECLELLKRINEIKELDVQG